MDSIIVLKDKWNNIYGIDSDFSSGSISIDNKLQKCSICTNGSTIQNVFQHKIKLYLEEHVSHLKKRYSKKFKDYLMIKINLPNGYLETNSLLFEKQKFINIRNLYNNEITYQNV